MIYLIGTKVCRNCDQVGQILTTLDIPWEKVTLDYEEHTPLIEQAKQNGYNEAPIACIRDSDGNYVYVAAGTSAFARLSIQKAFQRLVAA